MKYVIAALFALTLCAPASAQLPIDRPEQYILLLAADLVEAGWVQFDGAVNAAGAAVDVTDPTAVKFCAVGAIIRAGHDLGLSSEDIGKATEMACDRVSLRRPFPMTIWDWNDKPRRQAGQVSYALREAVQF